jgi:hypothetical protein
VAGGFIRINPTIPGKYLTELFTANLSLRVETINGLI